MYYIKADHITLFICVIWLLRVSAALPIIPPNESYQCDPINIYADAFTVRIEYIYFSKQVNSITAGTRIVVRDLSGKKIAEAQLWASPGQPTKITVKTDF